jgi:GntR family transcriptional repressor for pyruvate dehydrogenase complex
VAAQKRTGSRTREKPQQIADELRSLIIAGELVEGDSLGHEPDLVERFGVSRPSLREALRILGALVEPLAARTIAGSRRRKSIVKELTGLVDEEEAALEDPEAFGIANAAFHERLVALAGNQTLSIVAEMLNEIVARAVTAVSQGPDTNSTLAVRRRGIRSQHRLLKLLAAGEGAEAEEHWRTHMTVVAKVMLGQESATVVDLLHHD